ncbi:DUF6085 family protein [Streptomyces sp. NRRL S-1824]|uniref:DUF6085 family protein n=1 Tax=Streptomyces sp. NRRL S-1824 TaxID=1463889 RepID=UPI0004C7BF58|nr:DUF6085 family protein [Streptomyces sp. NRRL S-1824]
MTDQRTTPDNPATSDDAADNSGPNYAAEVECAIGLNVGGGGADGVHAARDAVLAVRDREMEQLRADLDRVQQAACRTAESLRKAEHADVQGRCPGCGGGGLFLGSGGHVTCPRIDCPNPSAADDLLHQRAHDWSTEQPPTT